MSKTYKTYTCKHCNQTMKSQHYCPVVKRMIPAPAVAPEEFVVTCLK